MADRHEERAAPTIDDLIERFVADYLPRKRESTRRDYSAMLDKIVRPELGKMKVADVRHADVDKLHRKVSAKTPYRANRMAAVLSVMMNFAVRLEWRDDNPVRGIERNHEERRQRYLTGDELRRLTEALAAYSSRQAANVVRLSLLTGARRGEVLSATWDQFDLATGTWIKPSSHTKQKREHRVPLSAPARQMVAELKADAERRGETTPYLFPARIGDGPMIEIKTVVDGSLQGGQDRGRQVARLAHTYASVLASAGLSLPVIGALLGHTQPGTTARYAHLFDDPLRAATERVGAIVTGAAAASQNAEVVPLARKN